MKGTYILLNTSMNKYYIQKKIKEVFIVHENDGSYNLFGSYVVNQQPTGVYKVSAIDSKYPVDPVEFSSLKYAVSYCVFEKNNKRKEKQRLVELDEIINSLDVNMAQHQKLAQKASATDKSIYLAKLLEDKLKKKQAISEIQRYTALSRYIQDKKFMDTAGEI